MLALLTLKVLNINQFKG